jgi:hypothetical protein
MTTSSTLLTVARARALFVSDLSIQSAPTRAEIEAVVRRMIRVHGGTRGCVAEVASAYGEHPELAAPRMTWALQTVGGVSWRKTACCRGPGLP